MKLCLLVDNGSVHNQKWIHALSQYNEIEIHVISLPGGLEYNNVTYHFLKIITSNKIDYFLNIPLVRKYISQIKPDLLHAHYATSCGFMGAASGFHPFILTGWGADIFDSPKNYLMNKIVKYGLKKADTITLLSKISQCEIKKLTNKEIHLVPFGVDIIKFSKKEKPQSTYIRIGTIRTLSEKYGVEYLIRALAILRKKYDNIKLEIIGDGDLRQKLESLSKELNIENDVTFHGFVSQTKDFEKYITLLNSLDIFCILSIIDSETFGVAAVEASACSIPVVASNVGGLTEVIENNNTGIIVPPKNAEKTAEALELLILNADLRQKLGNNGRKRVEDNYDWKKNVERMIDIYYTTIQSNQFGK